MNTCHYCGCKSGDFDPRFGADVELRPYGPNASFVCFYCANETPKRSAEVIKQMAIHFNAAINAGDGPKIIVLGEETGPRPLVTKSQ